MMGVLRGGNPCGKQSLSRSGDAVRSPTERDQRVQQIVAEVVRRRLRGECVRDEDVLAEHAELRDALAAALRLVAAGPGADGDETRAAEVSGGRPLPRVEFAGYELLEEIHRGGQGIVYQALQKSEKRKVAIKVLLSGPFASDRERARFQREIELLAQLKHPHIISIYHSGVTDDGRQFYVMDYVHGLPLDRYVRSRKLSLQQLLGLFDAVCDAVQYAHSRGVIHRDLKPSNILVDADGQVHVLDFGLAKLLAGPVDAAMSLTREPVGTLAYMAPEQLGDALHTVDARTDVYALGVVLYQLLTGRFPYPVDGPASEVMEQIRNGTPLPMRRAWDASRGVIPPPDSPSRHWACPIAPDLDAVVLKALHKDARDRYASVQEFRADLHRYSRGEPVLARRGQTWYKLRRTATRVVRRWPPLGYIAAVLLGFVVADRIGGPLLFHWTPIDRLFERTLTRRLLPDPPSETLRHTRVLFVSRECDLRRIAAELDVPGFDSDPPVRGALRHLFGRFLEKLAQARPRAVVLDTYMPNATERDPELRRGMEALAARGAGVAFGAERWWLKPEELPAAAPLLRELAFVGGLTIGDPAEGAEVDLAIQRGDGDALPGLALAGVLAERGRGKLTRVTLDPDMRTVTAHFYQPAGAGGGQARSVGEPAVFRATWIGESAGVTSEAGSDSELGVAPGDWVARLSFTIPPDATLRASTRTAEEFCAMSIAELAAWCDGQFVMLINGRPESEYARYEDGRRLCKGYVHAAALDALLTNELRIVPKPWHKLVLLGGSAALGLTIGATFARRGGLRAVWLAGTVAAGAAAAIAAYGGWRFVCNPFYPAVALVVACEAGAWVRRVTAPR